MLASNNDDDDEMNQNKSFKELIELATSISNELKRGNNNNFVDDEDDNMPYLIERAERMYSLGFKAIIADLKRIRNGEVIEELLRVVWGNYVSMFIHMNNVRMEENKKKNKLLHDHQNEIKQLKQEIAQYEQQNRERKIRKEMKIKMKVRERNIMLTMSSSKARKQSGAKSIHQIATEHVDEDNVSEDDSDVEKPLEYIDRTMKLNKKSKGSGVDRKLRVMLKDLNEQRRNEFEFHDWAQTMIADELFTNNPEFQVNIDDGRE
eukprot:g5572.t1